MSENIFVEASKCTISKKWKKILHEYSQGNFPEDITYDENNRTISRDDVVVKLSKKPHRVYHQLYEMLEGEEKTDQTIDSWKTMNKQQKEIKLKNYVNTKYKKLEQKERKKIYNKLKIGIILKNLDDSDIELDGFRITKIKNFKWKRD